MNDNSLNNKDLAEIILGVSGCDEEDDLFVERSEQLKQGLSLLQCYLHSLGENQKWQDFLESINKLHKEDSALLPENEAFKLKLKEILNDFEKLLASNATNPFLTSDAILNWFAISEKKVKKSETIVGNIEVDIIKKYTSPDFVTHDTLLFISNSRNMMSVRFNSDDSLYLCYNQHAGRTEQFSSHSELVAFLKKTRGQTMKFEWVTWNEKTDLSPLHQYKNELISNNAAGFLSEVGLHFLAQNAPNELKNILEQAKGNQDVSKVLTEQLIATDEDGCNGLMIMARHAGDQIETVLALAEGHDEIKDAFAQALVMTDRIGSTGFYKILLWAPNQLHPILRLAKKCKDFAIEIANALMQYSGRSTGFYYVVVWYGKEEVADLFALAETCLQMRDAIAKALVMKNRAGTTGLSALACSLSAQYHITTLLKLAEKNEVIEDRIVVKNEAIKDAIAEALSISDNQIDRNGYFAIARFGSVNQLKALHALSENHEGLKKVISEVESIEQGVLGQKMSLFMDIDAGKPLVEDERKKRELVDMDYGLAILYSYMNATGNLAWWIRSLQRFNKWDGTKESLYEKDVNTIDTQPLPLNKTESYILYGRIAQLLNNQPSSTEGLPEDSRGNSINLFLKPLLRDENTKTNASCFFSEKRHIVQHVTFAGHLDKTLLKRLLVKEHFALKAIYLLRNNGHHGSIRYSIEKEKWYLYNPNCSNEASFDDNDDGKDGLIADLYDFYKGPNQSISIEIATWEKDLDLSFLSTFYDSLSTEDKLKLFQGTGLHEVTRWAPEHLPKFLEFAKKEDRAKDAIALAMPRKTLDHWNLLLTIAKHATSQLPTLFELAKTHEGIKNSILSVYKLENKEKQTALSIITESAPPYVLAAFLRITGISCVEEMPCENAVVLSKV